VSLFSGTKGGSLKGFHTTKESVSMKGSNPIIPPGADFDGARQGRSNMRMAVVVVVVMHLVLFAGILFNACKQKEDSADTKGKVSSEMAQIVPPKTAPLPEPDPLPAPVPSLPSLPGVTAESLPPLPPVGSSALPPVPAPVSSGGLAFTPEPAAPVAQTVPGTEHMVASGDNFWTIGRKYGVSHKKIEQANPDVIPTRLKIGQKIIIPATQPEPVSAPAEVPVGGGFMYIVKSGDTLGHIALRHKVDVADIKTVNNMDSDLIRIGQQIKLPVSEIPATVPSSGSTLPSIPEPLPTSSSGPSLDPGTGLPVGGTEGAAKPSEN